MKNDIEQRLLAFLHDEILPPDLQVGRDEDLLSGEILDSLAVVRLQGFVEEEFDLQVPPSDFVVENFQSIAILADYVVRTKEA